MNEKIMKELIELADNYVIIDSLCYIECRKDGYGKRFCTEICKEEGGYMMFSEKRSMYKARVWGTEAGYVILKIRRGDCDG